MNEFLMKYGTIIWLLVLVVFFYLFLIRPQQKQQKQRGEMLNNLKKGDKILNHGGMIGTITEIKEDQIMVRISDKVEVPMVKEGIARILND
ncbi:MAG: preprotein translocase subunit YajC [Eubacteriales bacterium]|nr:preprotein translocase subunit YajC [Eubacteriales bacterium]MDD3073675.1 preprotein translocase subunit YajC [Eubacteriales bacterium]MDD4079228.1 preprotein translocase subunit YajC [Eubacteriales bacterium]MDD4769200.1 preprotein translocase subunit YajC [Eubacteriales bacterium]